VGLSGLTESLSKTQFDILWGQLKQQETGATWATFEEYTKQNDPKAFGEMLPDDKILSWSKQNFLFFTARSGKAWASVPARALKKVSANLLVLDQQKLLPVLASRVTLIVPEEERK